MCPDYERNPEAAKQPDQRAQDANIAASASPPRQEASSPNLSGRQSAGESSSANPAQRGGEEMRRQVDEISRQAKERGLGMLQEQKSAAAEQVTGVARALHETAEQLRNEQPSTASYMDQAADGLERFGRALRERDVDYLYAQAKDMARRQPGLLLGGAIAAGFVLSRFLKASPPEHHEQQGQGYTPQATAAPAQHAEPRSDGGEVRSGIGYAADVGTTGEGREH